MTIREYAETRGITYQAARNSIKRYSDELKDHITISYGMRVLDDFAVRFLDDHRRKSPVYISAETSEEFKSAQEKIEELRAKCEEVTEENRSLLKQIIVFQSKEKEYLSQIEQLQVQIEEKKSPEGAEEMRSRIRTAEAEAEELRTAKETAEAEAEKLKSDVQVAQAETEKLREDIRSAQAEAEQAKQAAETDDQERQRLAEEKNAADQERERLQAELQAVREQSAKDAEQAAETARQAERMKPWYKRLFGMD